MDRWDVGLLVVVGIGLGLVWLAPPEPTYSVSVREATVGTSAEVTPFVDLGTDAQQEFLRLVQGEEWRGHEPPALRNGYVRYKGALYRVNLGVSESSVASILFPLVGSGIALCGLVGLGGRRAWRRVRS